MPSPEEDKQDRDGLTFMLLGIGVPLALIAVAIFGGPALRWLIHQL